MNIYDDIEKARESLNLLVKMVSNRNFEDAEDYIDSEDFIDSLDEKTCKYMLRMIAYGSYKDFINSKEEI